MKFSELAVAKTNSKFWDFFNAEAGPRLARREETFRQMFKYLDELSQPVSIVETGCTRLKGNWAGDGQSTVLFDRYISTRDENPVCLTVDINKNSVQECISLVSQRTQVFQQDSVAFLSKLVSEYVTNNQTIDLLYLDSFDLDMTYWQPSAIHHLKELAVAIRALRADSLVVVDDCPSTADFTLEDNNTINFVTSPKIGGKGRLVAEFANSIGANCIFADYQAGWTNMV
ncbi:MAG: hypothetical protein ING36_08240 [Burkholderiales bacterium]|jgi:hypothetical protein|nr:hypothetical protein [Burkholderiales bacterium]MCA3161625.1 hypothetical protein [Burkholderiales bacterium]MCA3163872.1 hypothetical protein [Burkholderiales bacterium]MCA3165724.1 hypothetical protein [Burkholderiales bacterium]MCA3169956.1 hypothetical protein [Burkholderiales bacterium]